MKNANLLKRVSSLGFPLFNTEEDQNANLTLADMVKSKDLRLWEGFPVVLVNSAEKRLLNYGKIDWYLKNSLERLCLTDLLVMSLALYRHFKLTFSWADEFFNKFSNDSKKQFLNFLENISKGNTIKIANHEMSVQRIKAVFKNYYFSQKQAKLNELLSVKDDFNLEYSLSQVFSPKQKELFLKKLQREKMSKTEKEYFSRVVKKKVVALANPELNKLSQKLLRN
jgi:hypothetical protein